MVVLIFLLHNCCFNCDWGLSHLWTICFLSEVWLWMWVVLEEDSWNKLLWLFYRINQEANKNKSPDSACVPTTVGGRTGVFCGRFLHVILRSWWELCAPPAAGQMKPRPAEQLIPAVREPPTSFTWVLASVSSFPDSSALLIDKRKYFSAEGKNCTEMKCSWKSNQSQGCVHFFSQSLPGSPFLLM